MVLFVTLWGVTAQLLMSLVLLWAETNGRFSRRIQWATHEFYWQDKWL